MEKSGGGAPPVQSESGMRGGASSGEDPGHFSSRLVHHLPQRVQPAPVLGWGEVEGGVVASSLWAQPPTGDKDPKAVLGRGALGSHSGPCLSVFSPKALALLSPHAISGQLCIQQLRHPVVPTL